MTVLESSRSGGYLNVAISVVVPVYKEAGNIRPFLRRTEAVMEKLGVVYEIIFALDPSPDDTEAVWELAEHRYVAVETPLAWTSDHRHRRIGLAGLWDINGLSPVFPAFGPRLGNRVGFVGPFRRGLLSQYTTREPFVAALRSQRPGIAGICCRRRCHSDISDGHSGRCGARTRACA